MKKIVCIYHSIDLDGWMSAAIVKHWFLTANRVLPESPYINGGRFLYNPDFLGWNYGDPVPNLSEYDKIIMCDISFSKEEMRKLAENKEFIWIDHHISAIKDNSYLIDLAQCEGAKINLKIKGSILK